MLATLQMDHPWDDSWSRRAWGQGAAQAALVLDAVRRYQSELSNVRGAEARTEWVERLHAVRCREVRQALAHAIDMEPADEIWCLAWIWTLAHEGVDALDDSWPAGLLSLWQEGLPGRGKVRSCEARQQVLDQALHAVIERGAIPDTVNALIVMGADPLSVVDGQAAWQKALLQEARVDGPRVSVGMFLDIVGGLGEAGQVRLNRAIEATLIDAQAVLDPEHPWPNDEGEGEAEAEAVAVVLKEMWDAAWAIAEDESKGAGP